MCCLTLDLSAGVRILTPLPTWECTGKLVHDLRSSRRAQATPGRSVRESRRPDARVCRWQDLVVAENLAVQAWLRRDQRIMAWMQASADALAAELV